MVHFCDLQSSNAAPSAPPFQFARDSSGPIKYPNVYKPSEEAAEAKTNREFWDQQLGDEDKEKGRNQGFWGDALGSKAKEPAPVKKNSPYQEAAKESARSASLSDASKSLTAKGMFAMCSHVLTGCTHSG